jgi:hypothetical protein
MDLIMKSVSWVNDAVWNKYVGSGLKRSHTMLVPRQLFT